MVQKQASDIFEKLFQDNPVQAMYEELKKKRLENTLAASADKSKQSSRRLPLRYPRGEKFLGTMPLSWYAQTKNFPRSVVDVAIWLFVLDALSRTKWGTKLPAHTVIFGIGKMQDEFIYHTRRTIYKAIDLLENAGLIHVEQHDGRAPIVTLLQPPEQLELEFQQFQPGQEAQQP